MHQVATSWNLQTVEDSKSAQNELNHVSSHEKTLELEAFIASAMLSTSWERKSSTNWSYAWACA